MRRTRLRVLDQDEAHHRPGRDGSSWHFSDLGKSASAWRQQRPFVDQVPYLDSFANANSVFACFDGFAIVDVDPLLWHLIHMSLALIIVTALAVLWFAERSVEHLKLAIAALCFSTRCCCSSLLIWKERYCCHPSRRREFSEPRESNTITAGSNSLQQIYHWLSREQFHFVGTISARTNGCSRWKHRTHAGRSRDPTLRARAAGFLGTRSSLFQHCLYQLGGSIQGERRASYFPAKCGSPPVFSFELHRLPSQPTFVAAVCGLALSDIAKDPLPLMAAVPARSPDYPDIIVIQHESIFDPRKEWSLWKPQRGYFWRRIVAIGI